MDKLLHEVRTDHQHLVIFENPVMGRVMALDGVIQTTEADEFILPRDAHPCADPCARRGYSTFIIFNFVLK